MLAKSLTACLLTAALGGSAAWSQHRDSIIKVDIDLVAVSATVTDSQSRPVINLGPQHFQIWEDKVLQEIEYFSVEDVPISLAVVFDVSGSMARKIDTARDAAVTFLKSGNPQDEYLLVEFSTRANVKDEFSRDISSLRDRIVFTSAGGKTALYDAVYLAVEKLRKGTNPRKAMLLVTDGMDNHSRYAPSNIREFLREKDVQVYAIGIEEYGAIRGTLSSRTTLRELAETTGGRAFFVDSVRDLEDVCLKIADLLKTQYIIGYRSTNLAKDGKWRKIRLKVTPPKGVSNLSIQSKSGYYAAAR